MIFKLTVFLLVALDALKFQRSSCDGLAMARKRATISGVGGSLDGDPAPGRSPGPPEIVDDYRPTFIVSQSKPDPCDLEGERDADDDDDGTLNVTVDHPRFKTELLVPGLVYQVILETTERDVEFRIVSHIDGYATGRFVDGGELCESRNVHRGSFAASTRHVVNWTVPDMDSFEVSVINITFKINYKTIGARRLHEVKRNFPINPECQLTLKLSESVITSTDLPTAITVESLDCDVWFPGHDTRHGLVVDMHRLNVPCAKGYLHFAATNNTQRQRSYRSHKQVHLCGKLEELAETERHIYFPSSPSSSSSPSPSHLMPFLRLHGRPVFAFAYRLVDYCYNVTFDGRNGTFELKPNGMRDGHAELECTFRIYLPYGNRVALTLTVGDVGATPQDAPSSSGSSGSTFGASGERTRCDGLSAELHDGDGVWTHCTRVGDAQRQIEIVSRANKVILKVALRDGDAALRMRMSYRAEPVADVVGPCAFGWIALRQFCVAAVEAARLPWSQAEIECGRRGGHLVSIRDDYARSVVDSLLLNSPGYKDHNAYWIGASDKTQEGDFHWSDGLPFSYTYWFPGWSQHGDYNRQPNDDGLSEQDCIEVRRVYSLPTSSANLAPTFMWNDRDCATPNYFICERLQNDEPLDESWPPDCNRTVILSRQQPKVTVTSPGFPRQYPDNSDCGTEINAPPGYRITLDFEELVLENEPSCSYDYLEIVENNANQTDPTTRRNQIENGNGSSSGGGGGKRRLCGDWSSKLKLLRYVSEGSRLRLKFSSDYSHHFSGYKARISMENAVQRLNFDGAIQCSDDDLVMFNNSCYLFESGPYVTWPTADEICRGLHAELASIWSPEEDKFITAHLRNMPDYRNNVKYWLGARLDSRGRYKWSDGSNVTYSRWLPGRDPSTTATATPPTVAGKETKSVAEETTCLATQYMPSPTPMLPSGLYWIAERCNTRGGYICKRASHHATHARGVDFNRTYNGTGGELTSPNYPRKYFNNLDYTVRINGPERTRIVVRFDAIDLEPQAECLYDYVELRSSDAIGAATNARKLCGSHHRAAIERFDYVADGNAVALHFHSDHSIAGNGFALRWHSVDVSGCPMQTLTAREGTVTSPNYPDFLLSRLNCTIDVLAPPGKRVWLEFDDYDVGRGDTDGSSLEVKLDASDAYFRPYRTDALVTDGTFLSRRERMQVRLTTGARPRGTGFRATYRILDDARVEKVTLLGNDTVGRVSHLNYPGRPAERVDFVQRFLAPLGHVVLIELYQLRIAAGECANASDVVVYDDYAETNGTKWTLCRDDDGDDRLTPRAPIAVTSFMNALSVRQRNAAGGVPLNGTIRVRADAKYREKLLRHRNNLVAFCRPNPCQHGGKCLSKGGRSYCKCQGHYTGLFCALTQCDLEPCVFGTCELTEIGYRCHCKSGYVGPTCDQKRKPCESNPCEGRGVCTPKGDGFQCQCHAWWEGTRCERRMLHIPYKPLSERMLHEPFWLGLMTVFIVMAIIGIVWCAKRHFPEKIEKLLAEEDDRNRSTISSLRSASVREQLAASGASAAVTVTPSPGGPGAPRSLFGRLGIRKPSILSLTSPHASGYAPATARTFSLDDLLKPPPRRTPSPKKKRNNSTPTKKNAAEKKQILQQLIAPTKQSQPKLNLGELMQMTESKAKSTTDVESSREDVKETRFASSKPGTSAQLTLSDPKLEKKVTFARLLSKVSAEMSSGSEIELGIMQANRLSCAFARPASTPPSPGGTAARSPNSTSSNQGSDSLTSSDLAIPSILSASVSDLAANRFNVRHKPSSADSILAMFRNFSSSSAGVNLASSLKVSPSTTPTASSPQDDVAGDDDSTTSSIHTPGSMSSVGPTESPIGSRRNQSQTTIEVPVLDALSAHKNAGTGNFLHPPTILLEIPSTINKCLSPIREMPTPLPSPMPTPAMTPIMRRSGCAVTSSADDGSDGDNKISIELPNISIGTSDDEDDEDDLHCVTDIAIDPQAEDGLILEEAAVMQNDTHSLALRSVKSRPPPLDLDNFAITINEPDDELTSAPIATTTTTTPTSLTSPPSSSSSFVINAAPPLIIPTLTIQTPSPTHHQHRPPSLTLPGSPPPRTARSDDHFRFPSETAQPKQSSGGGSGGRKLLKEFDKPTSLDLPAAPPLITVTCNMSEAESDVESISPVNKAAAHHHHHHPQHPHQHLPGVVQPGGMTYLSPFSIVVTRGDHTASESNLSSSGYSSMASPGPSRCGSSNPLCPSEMEDPGAPGPGPGPSTNLHAMRRSTAPIIKTASNAGGEAKEADDDGDEERRERRGRSDSETLSDDLLLESNDDEGIGTDHLDEKIEDGVVKSARELKVYIGREGADAGPLDAVGNAVVADLDQCLLQLPATTAAATANLLAAKTLQLPSIVVQCDTIAVEKHLSPVSSRSESPLSDRTTGMGRFSPQFYGKSKDFLPFTDSDGLYDFPSSEKMNVTSSSTLQLHHRKATGRRREKKARQSKSPSPTKASAAASNCHLDIPTKECYYRAIGAPRKLSPKRRLRNAKVISSSSSSDSIASNRDVKRSSSSPETIRWSATTTTTTAASVDWPTNEKVHRSPEASGEDTGDDVNNVMLPKPEILSKHTKISKLRAIGHQIRFLRRLEVSLKRRERVVSPTESLPSGGDDDDDDGVDSPRATSPLLQQHRGDELKKSFSSGRLHCNNNHHHHHQATTNQSNYKNSNNANNRRGKYKRDESLLTDDRRGWKKVVVLSSTGHSD